MASQPSSRHATASDLYVRSALPAMAQTDAGGDNCRGHPASDMCYASGFSENPENARYCCRRCCSRCCSCGDTGGNGAAGYPWRVAKETCGCSARCETRCGVLRCRAPGPRDPDSSASCRIEHAQDPHAGSKAGKHCNRGHCCATNSTDSTSDGATCRKHSDGEMNSASAASSHPRRPPSGCGSTSCIMAAGVRPKRLCICMVSDFFFPSLGGVEMHIYELSVRLARKGEASIKAFAGSPPYVPCSFVLCCDTCH